MAEAANYGPAAGSRRWLVAWLVFAGICVAAVVYFARVFVPGERAAAIEAWRGRLSAMADDRKTAITAWLDERRADAMVVAEYPTVIALIAGQDAEAFPLPPSELPQHQLRGLLDSVQAVHGYGGLYVVGANGQVWAGSTGSPPPTASCRSAAKRALTSGMTQFEFFTQEDGSPMLAAVAPVLDQGRPIGAVLLVTDPGRWLYPLLQTEPIPSTSAESLLGRQVGDQIEYLNPLRLRPGRPMSFRLPVKAAPLAVVAAIRGEEEFKEYLDYRGVPVMGAPRHVPGTDWGLVVKVDREEALAGFRRNVTQAAAAIAGLLLAVAGLGFGAQRAVGARHRRELGEGEARFALLRDHASDGIWFVSADGTIRDATESAAAMHGCTREEFVGRNVREFRPPEDPAAMPGLMDAVRRGDGTSFETLHTRRDGSVFPVEVSSRAVQLEGEEVFLSTYRDISDRRRDEARIARLNRLLRTISEINQLVVRERDRDRLLAEACRIVVEAGGFRMAWIGFTDETAGTVVPAAAAGFEDGYLSSITFRYDDTPLGQSPVGRAIRAGSSAVVNDWAAADFMAPWREAARTQGYRSSAAFALIVRGDVVGAFVLYSAFAGRFDGESTDLLEKLAGDIAFALEAMETDARRLAAERELAAQHSTLKGITESTEALIFSVDREYRYTSFNRGHAAAMRALYGAEIELGESLLARMTVEEDRRQTKLDIDRALAGERFVREVSSGDEARSRTFFEVSHNPVRLTDGTVIGVAVFAADISERRHAAEALLESRQLMQDVLDNSSSLIYIVDTEGRILLANSMLETVLGASKDELRGKTRHALMPKRIADQHRANDLEVIAGGRSIAFEEANEEPDGTHVYSTVKFPLRDGQGRIYAVGGMSTDATQQRRASALAEREAKFSQAALDSLPGLFYLFDEQGRFLRWNKNFEEVSGYSGEEIAAMVPGDFFAGEDKGAIAGAVEQALSQGNATVVADFLSRDLVKAPYLFTGRRFLFGATQCVIGMGVDITERKRAEEDLRRSEERFRRAVTGSPFPALLHAEDGTILEVSDSWLAATGYTRGELATIADWTERAYGERKELVRTEIEALYGLALPKAEGDHSIRTRRGTTRIWEFSSSPLGRLPDGRRLVLSMALDVTERRAAENEVRKLNAELEERVRARTGEVEAARARVEDLYNRAPCGYHSLDGQGRFQAINDTELEWLGYARDEVVGKLAFADVITAASREVFRENFPEFKRRGWVKDLEFDMVRRDGSTFRVLLNATATTTTSGEYLSSRSTVFDITKRKSAEEAVLRLNAELQERATALAAANKELEAFSYSVSHDLRAPLRAIDGFSRIVVEDHGDSLGDEGRRQLEVIRTNTQKMGRLIDDLLAFSRAGRAELHGARIAMAPLVHAAFAEIEPAPAEQRRIDFVVEELPDAWADPALIRQVWTNLLSNAMKFSRTREHTVIRVTGARADHRAVYQVSDNGVGFDMRFADKLFGVFQRLHSTREFPGTGVGLALVQRIVQRHGGEVWAVGEVDGGATFSFALPEEADHEQR